MTMLQAAVVSRKTPRDGKLEISAQTAERLGGVGTNIRVSAQGTSAAGMVVSMPCGCKGETRHVSHVFLHSDVLRALPPESSVVLELEQDAQGPSVSVVPA